MQRWADAKVFAFVNLRSTDAKAFCQSSACVPEILLRLASVWGEWVNTVGRTVRFLVAKALNFKIRGNSRPGCVFCICVIRVCVFLRTVVSSPIASTECLCFGCAKDVNAKDATQKRKMRPAHGRVCPSDYEVMF